MLEPHDIFLVSAAIMSYFGISQTISVLLEARIPLSGFLISLIAGGLIYQTSETLTVPFHWTEVINSTLRLWGMVF